MPRGNSTILSLADGSAVNCDPETQLAVDFSSLRRIRLNSGVITVQAAPMPGRPMVIETPLSDITVVDKRVCCHGRLAVSVMTFDFDVSRFSVCPRQYQLHIVVRFLRIEPPAFEERISLQGFEYKVFVCCSLCPVSGGEIDNNLIRRYDPVADIIGAIPDGALHCHDNIGIRNGAGREFLAVEIVKVLFSGFIHRGIALDHTFIQPFVI